MAIIVLRSMWGDVTLTGSAYDLNVDTGKNKELTMFLKPVEKAWRPLVGRTVDLAVDFSVWLQEQFGFEEVSMKRVGQKIPSGAIVD